MDGQATKDTNRYLVTRNYTKSYLRDGRETKDTNEYLVTKNYAKFYPQGWTDDQGYQGVPGHKKLY